MTWTLSITGKGGVGKTTLAAMAVRWLSENGFNPTLAIDADPNVCLDVLLGVPVSETVGGVREEAKRIAQEVSAGGMGKQNLLDLKIQEAIVESRSFDLISMGRPEGPGCYCYANNVLRQVLARLAGSYPTVVIDNEAGLENLSRRTVQETTWLIFVSDASMRGLTTARRLLDLSREMDIKTQSLGLILNRSQHNSDLDRAKSLFLGTPVNILGALPNDLELAEHDTQGKTVFELDAHNPVYIQYGEMLKQITCESGF